MKSLLRSTIDNGTINWDLPILKSEAILVQAPCAARTGDLIESPFGEGDDCLKWGHIHMFLCQEDGEEILIARIKLFHWVGVSHHFSTREPDQYLHNLFVFRTRRSEPREVLLTEFRTPSTTARALSSSF